MDDIRTIEGGLVAKDLRIGIVAARFKMCRLVAGFWSSRGSLSRICNTCRKLNLN